MAPGDEPQLGAHPGILLPNHIFPFCWSTLPSIHNSQDQELAEIREPLLRNEDMNSLSLSATEAHPKGTGHFSTDPWAPIGRQS